jgi:Uma2 family endonuclease
VGATAARQLQPISVEDYLQGEEQAKRKHEYLAGIVYAMTGGQYNHNLISSRVLIELGIQLKDGPCVALGSDNKVRIDVGSRTWMYYPDVTVVCGDNIIDKVYQDRPTLVVEVLSASTRRIDEGEKCDNYLQLPSLKTYIMLEQHFAAAIVHQRTTDGFQRTVYDDIKAAIPLPKINASLSLAEVYAGVKFVKETDEEYEAIMQR